MEPKLKATERFNHYLGVIPMNSGLSITQEIDFAKKCAKSECEEQSGSLSLFEGKYAAPTIGEVIMWLYKYYKVWLGVEWENSAFTCRIQSAAKRYDNLYNLFPNFSCPIKAYEVSIEYTLIKLKKLIHENG